VQQKMMVMLVEQCSPVTQRPTGSVNNQSQTVGVRQDTGQGDEATIARVIGRFGRNHPTDEEMSYRRHALCLPEANPVTQKGKHSTFNIERRTPNKMQAGRLRYIQCVCAFCAFLRLELISALSSGL